MENERAITPAAGVGVAGGAGNVDGNGVAPPEWRPQSMRVDPALTGIGGWLILFIIGLVLAPIRMGSILATDFLPLFKDGTWQALTTPGSEHYHAMWGPLLAFEIAGNLGTLVGALAVLLFLSRKSRLTPRIAIAWLAFNLAVMIGDHILVQTVPVVAEQGTDPEGLAELARSAIGALIWIPYWLVSKRVKQTFVE